MAALQAQTSHGCARVAEVLVAVLLVLGTSCAAQAQIVPGQPPLLKPKAAAEKTDAKAWLIAARAALERGDLEGAEIMAAVAEETSTGGIITKITRWWTDTPDKVRRDVQIARTNKAPAPRALNQSLETQTQQAITGQILDPKDRNVDIELPDLRPAQSVQAASPEQPRLKVPDEAPSAVPTQSMSAALACAIVKAQSQPDKLLSEACAYFQRGQFKEARELGLLAHTMHERDGIRYKVDPPRMVYRIPLATILRYGVVGTAFPFLKSDHASKETHALQVATTGSSAPEMPPARASTPESVMIAKNDSAAPIQGTVRQTHAPGGEHQQRQRPVGPDAEECEPPAVSVARKTASGLPAGGWLLLAGIGASIYFGLRYRARLR